MDVYFYKNTKRLNSTALPPTHDAKAECTLKDACSIIEPVLILSLISKPAWNYFKFEDRYYWITNIISVKQNLWEIHGTVDALATLRGHILATTAFVVYDSTANTQIPDGRLAIKTDVDTYTATANMPWDFDSGTGSYLICTTGDTDEFDWQTFTTTTNARNGTGVYMIPKSSISELGFDVTDMTLSIKDMSDQFWTDFNADSYYITHDYGNVYINIWNSMYGTALLTKDLFTLGFNALKLFAQNLIGGGSALSNIKAAFWIPFVLPAAAVTDVSGKPLALGTYEDVITGLKRVNNPVITSLGVNVTIPWHYNDWRNASCTEVMLYIPMIGCINIPTDAIKGQNTLVVTICLNCYSGAMAVEVKCNGGHIGTYGSNVAMPYMVGDSNMNVAAIANTITAGATSNPVGVAAGLSQSITPMFSSVGGIGGGAGTGLTDKIVCICRCHDTSQDPATLRATIGTPTNQLKTLSTSLGYVQTLNAQLNCGTISGEPNPTQTEIDMVNSALNSGVYLE